MGADVHVVVVALCVLTPMDCVLLEEPAREGLLRRLGSRRQACSEVSLVRSVIELLAQDESLWRLLNH